MHIPWELPLSFALGLLLLYFIGRLLFVPTRFVWRVMAGALLGALAIWVVNQFEPITGFSVTLNPFSALAVGLLGLPGAGLVLGLQFFLRG